MSLEFKEQWQTIDVMDNSIILGVKFSFNGERKLQEYQIDAHEWLREHQTGSMPYSNRGMMMLIEDEYELEPEREWVEAGNLSP